MNSNIRWRVMLLQGVMILVLAGAAVIAYGAGTFSHNQIKGRGRRGSRVGSILVALGLVAAFAVPAVNAADSNTSIVTTPSAGGTVGTVINDTAIWHPAVSGDTPGDVTFSLYAPGDTTCASAIQTFGIANFIGGGMGSYSGTSGDYTTTAVGIYRWTATYNGDANNQPVTSGCQDEQVTITKAQPSIGTTPSAGSTVGTVINDTATVSGGYSPTGDVTFKLYAPGDTTCVSAIQTFANVTLSGLTATSGNYTTAAVGIYRWTATYNGDANNLTATSGCQDEQVTTTTQVAAAVTLPKAGAGPQQQGSSAPGGGGPLGSGIAATLLLALIGSVLFALRRRHGAETAGAEA